MVNGPCFFPPSLNVVVTILSWRLISCVCRGEPAGRNAGDDGGDDKGDGCRGAYDFGGYELMHTRSNIHPPLQYKSVFHPTLGFHQYET